ncbi:MAG TPA: hypothetical protein VIU61_00245 [Kofleriaceae bacterium]
MIETIGFVTRDRPVLLRRAVASAFVHARVHERSPRLLVVDDSIDRNATLDALRSLRVEVSYVGHDEKVAICARLAASTGVPRAVVELGLFGDAALGFSAGANRNALLLASAGRAVLGLDDDMCCELAVAPGDGDRPLTLSNGEPTAMWFYGDRVERMHAVRRRNDVDLLAAHEALLGRDLASLVKDGEPAGTEHFARELQHGYGRVAISVSGVHGDCGLSSPLPYLMKGGATRERLLADYERHRVAREILRVVEAPAITRRAFCMTGAIGLDHRELLPPFLPVGRGEDGVFATTLRLCDPFGFIGLVPVAVLHDPQGGRTFDPGALVRAFRVSDCVQLLSQAAPFGDPRQGLAARLWTLGRYLVDLASRPWAELIERLREQHGRQLTHHLPACEAMLAEHPDAPVAWRRDLSRHLVSAVGWARSMDDFLPSELGELPVADARARFQRLLLGYGELLAAWPTLVAAARNQVLPLASSITEPMRYGQVGATCPSEPVETNASGM